MASVGDVATIPYFSKTLFDDKMRTENFLLSSGGGFLCVCVCVSRYHSTGMLFLVCCVVVIDGLDTKEKVYTNALQHKT